jgi:hypothetical protein
MLYSTAGAPEYSLKATRIHWPKLGDADRALRESEGLLPTAHVGCGLHRRTHRPGWCLRMAYTLFQPSLRDLDLPSCHPSLERLGYSHLSLRDMVPMFCHRVCKTAH